MAGLRRGQDRRNQIGQWNKAGLGAHIVTARQVDAVQRVSGHQPLDLIQCSERIEGAELGLQIVGL